MSSGAAVAALRAAGRRRAKKPAAILDDPGRYLGKTIRVRGLLFTAADEDVGTSDGDMACVYLKDGDSGRRLFLTLGEQVPADIPGPASMVLDRILGKAAETARIPAKNGERLVIAIEGTVRRGQKRFEGNEYLEAVYLDIG